MWLISQALCTGQQVSVLPRERARRKHLCISDFVVPFLFLMGRAVGMSLSPQANRTLQCQETHGTIHAPWKGNRQHEELKHNDKGQKC